MTPESASLHIRSTIEEVAEETDIPEAVLYAAMADGVFIETQTARLIAAMPAGLAAGNPDFDQAAADFADGLAPAALELLHRYQEKLTPSSP